MTQLTAVICAHNEEQRIAACLDRLCFCDEILVLADRCSDKTAQIARGAGARVLEGEFPVEGARKALGIQEAKGAWILEIDADEHADTAMAAEIENAMRGDKDWYDIPVWNYIGTTLVKNGWGGSFGVRRATRLFKRDCKTWSDEIIHPSFKMTGAYGGLLTAPIHHYVDESIADMIQRLNRYTEAHAQQLRRKGKIPGFFRSLLRGCHRFLKSYFSREGYKEGAWGLLLATMAFLYPILSAFKARLER